MGLFSISRIYFSPSSSFFFFPTNRGTQTERGAKTRVLLGFGFSHADLLCEN